MKASRKRPSRLAQKFSRRAAAHFALPFQVNKGFPLERAPQSRTTPIYTEEAQSALASAPIALPSGLRQSAASTTPGTAENGVNNDVFHPRRKQIHGFSQIVRKRMAYRGNAAGISVRHPSASASWLATGNRSTETRRGIRQAGQDLPQPRRRCSQRLRHQPRALGLCLASSLRLL